MRIGYLRVSTKDQNLDLQRNALLDFGCEKLFEETVSALSKVRPEFDKLMNQLRKGDEVVVWRLDRLGRSLRDLIRIVDEFKNQDVSFISLTDKMDTSTAHGRLVFNFFASIAEFERELIRERTIAGIQAAKKNGRVSGRRKGLSVSSKIKATEAAKLYASQEENRLTVDQICTHLKISKGTFYSYLDLKEVDRTKRPKIDIDSKNGKGKNS